jgi:hypothetical protein
LVIIGEHLNYKGGTELTKIKVRCGNCKKEVYIEDYERTSCPNCGHVITGPKYKQSSGLCYITTACVEAAGLHGNCLELQSMRYLRDAFLYRTDYGQKIIEDYYATAPYIVEKIKKDENSAEILSELFLEVKNIASLVNDGKLPLATERYISMVNELKNRYYEPSKKI